MWLSRANFFFYLRSGSAVTVAPLVLCSLLFFTRSTSLMVWKNLSFVVAGGVVVAIAAAIIIVVFEGLQLTKWRDKIHQAISYMRQHSQ